MHALLDPSRSSLFPDFPQGLTSCLASRLNSPLRISLSSVLPSIGDTRLIPLPRMGSIEEVGARAFRRALGMKAIPPLLARVSTYHQLTPVHKHVLHALERCSKTTSSRSREARTGPSICLEIEINEWVRVSEINFVNQVHRTFSAGD